MSVEILERRRPTVALEPTPETRSSHSRRWPLALAALFCVATAYHWLQSRGHVTPAIFTDELMFSELARSLAAGDGLTVRGEGFLSVVSAGARPGTGVAGRRSRRVRSREGAERGADVLRRLPAWALARLVVRPAYALGVGAATVAEAG